MKAVDAYILETEKAKVRTRTAARTHDHRTHMGVGTNSERSFVKQELLKEHQKKIDAYGAAKAKTAKEKAAKKQNPIKVVEVQPPPHPHAPARF